MIDGTSIIGSSEFAQASRAADARVGTTISVAATAVKTEISSDDQVVNTVIPSESDKTQNQFLYNSEGNLQTPPADQAGQQVQLKA